MTAVSARPRGIGRAGAGYQSDVMLERRDFRGEASSVASARWFVTEVAGAWGVPLGDAVLMVSELATNAVIHAHSPFTVVISCTTEVLRVEVHDSDPTAPLPGTAVDQEATSGRGLMLVVTLARRWGYQSTGAGKTVWFEV